MLEEEFVAKIIRIHGEAYVVGGWVRDTLLGVAPKDKDYVITGVSEEDFKETFPYGTKVGKSFPVYLLEINGQSCEVAFARHKCKGDVSLIFSDQNSSITDDLYRRDITMNSMAINLETLELIDPFHGQQHIKEKSIFPTSEYFIQDPIRALRAARQAAQFNFTIDKSAIELMKQCKQKLLMEPKERLFNELYKALTADKPSLFFTALVQAQLLDITYPQIHALIGQTQPVVYHPEGDSFDHTMDVLDRVAVLNPRVEVRFAALVHDLGKGLTPKEQLPSHHLHDMLGLDALRAFNQYMTLPNRWLACAEMIIQYHMRIAKLKQPGKIVDFILALQKNPIGDTGFSDIVFVDKGSKPDCLLNFNEYVTAIRKVKGNRAPQGLRGKAIGEWIRQRQIQEYCKTRLALHNELLD